MIYVDLPDPPAVAPAEAKYLLIDNFGNPRGWYANKSDVKVAKMILTQTLQPGAQRNVIVRKLS